MKKKKQSATRINGLFWILPAFIFLVVIIYYSIFFTFNLSTMDWDGLSPVKTSVGMKNFVRLFHDKVFWKTIQNTIVYFIITFVVQNTLGFLFAAILHTKVKFATLHKCLIFIPTILAPATMAPVFRLMFSPQGMLQQFFKTLHIPITVDWLARPNTALFILMGVAVWEFTGMSFILYFAAVILPLAALQLPFTILLTRNFDEGIPTELIEAARIDGASTPRVFWHIILPLTKPIASAIVVLTLINSWNSYLLPLLFLQSPSMQTVTLLPQYFQGEFTNDQTKILAAAVITAIPEIAAYLLMQKNFEQGMSAGALK